MIARLSEAMGTALVGNNFSPIPWKWNCFRTRASAVGQQVQSASVCVNSDQVTEQSSRCKLSVAKKREQLRVHILNSH